MRHLKKGRKLGRKRGQRRALLNTLAVSLIKNEKMKTTTAKAKELRPFIERLVTYGKKQDLAALRRIQKRIPKEAAYKLYHEIAPKYKDREGGYTRISQLAKRRVHDGAQMSIIEFV
jgi:large subunit ribosomal protein L17